MLAIRAAPLAQLHHHGGAGGWLLQGERHLDGSKNVGANRDEQANPADGEEQPEVGVATRQWEGGGGHGWSL